MKKFKEYYNFPYADLNYKPMVDLNADVRKVKVGYGVYADKFVKGKRVITQACQLIRLPHRQNLVAGQLLAFLIENQFQVC